MEQKADKRSQSRQGKHRDDKYRVQAYYEACEKAIFVLVAKSDNASLTDTIKSAMFDRAKALGILDKQGRVASAFKDALAVETMIIEQADHNRKETNR